MLGVIFSLATTMTCHIWQIVVCHCNVSAYVLIGSLSGKPTLHVVCRKGNSALHSFRRVETSPILCNRARTFCRIRLSELGYIILRRNRKYTSNVTARYDTSYLHSECEYQQQLIRTYLVSFWKRGNGTSVGTLQTHYRRQKQGWSL